MLTPELLSAEKAELERDLADYENKRRRLNLVNELLKCYGSEPEPGSTLVEDFEGRSLTAAIIEFLGARHQEFFTARELIDSLRLRRFKTDVPNFPQRVHSSLSRKVSSGDLEVGQKQGHRSFRISSTSPWNCAAKQP